MKTSAILIQTLKLPVLGCLLVLLLGACSTQRPIHNINGSPVPSGASGGTPSMMDVKDTIIEAAEYKRWRISERDDDTLEANITVRGRHQATISIDYSESSYSISLVRSEGLDERDGRIHRNYNKWVILLDREIQKRLKQ